MTSVLPLLMIFDFDYTLLPFSIEDDIFWPCSKFNGSVIDTWNDVISYFPEVPTVFEKLKQKDIKIAIIYSSLMSEEVIQLINLFDWDRYISYKEIYPGVKINHLKNVQTESQIPFNKIIYFDDDKFYVQAALKLGIFSVNVPRGMTLKILEDTLQKYKTKIDDIR